MKKRRATKIVSIIMIIMLIASMTACGNSAENTKAGSGEENTITATVEATIAATEAATEDDNKQPEATGDTEWVFYWYLCGSDLESENGFATTDLQELLAVSLPENVKIIIETGGTTSWQNEMMNPDFLERYLVDSTGIQLLEQQPLASMGSEETLSSFLAFAKANYPGAKTAFIFWNHGGGSVSGAEFDQNFEGDSLTLDEMYRAFAANYELSIENPPFDIIGFDTCLMATVDNAYNFSDIGKYMVASQETEPGNGWYYTGIANALLQNPSIEAAELGKVICDTYQEGCELAGTADNITLSLINLSKVSALVTAYNEFGKEALANACADPAFFSEFGRIAVKTENYGGNTKEQGFTNMTDLGHLARQSAEMLTGTSETVLTSLADCVEYKINGPYRTESTGLSCYYSYNADVDNYIGYVGVGVSDAFKYFYGYELTGELSDEGMQYIADMSYDELQPIETLETQGWENHALDVDSDGAATLTLGETAQNILSGVYIQLYYVDVEQDLMLLLGSDNDLVADWETGVFKDNFRGVWGAINGNLVNMELSFEGDGYNLYSVPVVLNGEDYNLSVIYDFTTATYEIQGAKQPIDENGMADKNLRELVEGDVINTIHYAASISDENSELMPVPISEIIVGSALTFEEIDLGDGQFIQMFEMRDMQGYSAYSDTIVFDVVDGVITTTVNVAE